MPATVTPVSLFGSGYSYGTNQIIFNTADHGTPLLAELSEAEADATTGDYREIIRAILHKTEALYAALTTKPNKFTIRKSKTLNSDDKVVETYVVSVTVDATLTNTTAET